MTRLLSALGIAVLALNVHAQEEEVLVLSGGETRQVGAACVSGDLRCRYYDGFFDFFMRDLTSRDWKVVVIEWYADLPPDRKERLLPALQAHLERGGRLLLVYMELDQWPELQELVDVTTAGEPAPVVGRRIWSVDPPHPTWGRPVAAPLIAGPLVECVAWPDEGDYLEPGSGGYVLATWDDPAGSPAIVLSRAGRVIVASFSYDGFCGYGASIAEHQIPWLLSCQPDIDGDGELTFFDFLAFQNLFAAGDARADFAFDGQLNFFDFLAFQDQFSIGCP